MYKNTLYMKYLGFYYIHTSMTHMLNLFQSINIDLYNLVTHITILILVSL